MFSYYAEINLMDHKPSVVAAAATLVALDTKLAIEDVRLKMNSISQHPLLEPVSFCIHFFVKFH
jgi:cyclin D5